MGSPEKKARSPCPNLMVVCTNLIIEPVEVAEGLQVLACDREPKAFTQHLVWIASSQRPAYLSLHLLHTKETKC